MVKRVHIWVQSYTNLNVRPILVLLYPNSALGTQTHEKPKKCLGLIKFATIEELRVIHKALLRENNKIVNEDKQPIKIGLAYDSRCYGLRKWVGVVIRNLPDNSEV